MRVTQHEMRKSAFNAHDFVVIKFIRWEIYSYLSKMIQNKIKSGLLNFMKQPCGSEHKIVSSKNNSGEKQL